MNHVRPHTQRPSVGARARELSASLGPVPSKSNYSKRDRKLLRSRSSLSIYTARSRTPWGSRGWKAYERGLCPERLPSLFLSCLRGGDGTHVDFPASRSLPSSFSAAPTISHGRLTVFPVYTGPLSSFLVDLKTHRRSIKCHF